MNNLRGTKVLGLDDKPLKVYHASSANFDKFSKQELGSNTGSKSADLGFFFTKDKQVAMSYFSKGKHEEKEAANSETILINQLNFFKKEKDTVLNSYRETKNKKIIPLLKDLNSKIKDLEAQLLETDEDVLDYITNEIDSDENVEIYDAYLYECYLNIRNPFIQDEKGEHYDDRGFSYIIDEALEKGHDGVIIKNTYDSGSSTGFIETDIYVVFDAEQIVILDKTFFPPNQDVLENQGLNHLKSFKDFK